MRLIAVKEFEQELESIRGNANAAYELGEIHRNAGEFDKPRNSSRSLCNTIPILKKPNWDWPTFYALQKPDQALPHLQKAVGAKCGT